MHSSPLAALRAEIADLDPDHAIGRVTGVEGNILHVSGLSGVARMGDTLRIQRENAAMLEGEVLQMSKRSIVMMPFDAPTDVALGQRVHLARAATIAPDDSWIGRIVDPFGKPLDGRPVMRGTVARDLGASPPPAASRRPLGGRLETGMAAFNTLLPVVRGQRIGLFAGSGVGKTKLLGHLGRNMQADVVVIALIGERGRELREFAETVLGPEGMKRSVIIAATSDRSPVVRRRCASTAISVAEHFRDQGLHVLFLADSVTRFAEAHREVATATGELPALRGFPASTSHKIMSLCERAGPGPDGAGDITAIFSVLVAGSDMEEPVADILRGVLDGHVILDRSIAERGRFPAIDLLRSVSRSLPDAANEAENQLIQRARSLLGSYARSETMVKAGLYTEGIDPELDQALKVWPELDAFIGEAESVSIENSFNRLSLILRRAIQGRQFQRKAAMRRDPAESKGRGADPAGQPQCSPAAQRGTGVAVSAHSLPDPG